MCSASRAAPSRGAASAQGLPNHGFPQRANGPFATLKNGLKTPFLQWFARRHFALCGHLFSWHKSAVEGVIFRDRKPVDSPPICKGTS
jgi:hypothetical protein